MREIKFRVFSKKLNIMLTSKTIKQSSDGLVGIINKVMPGLDCKKGVFIPTEDTDLEIMQYTGLKDKKGTEIYEGDIVAYLDSGEPIGYSYERDEFMNYGKVIWDEEFARFDITNRNDVDCEDVWEKDFIEVIGNIYENPELLEGN